MSREERDCAARLQVCSIISRSRKRTDAISDAFVVLLLSPNDGLYQHPTRVVDTVPDRGKVVVDILAH